jgi:hypothetical protein
VYTLGFLPFQVNYREHVFYDSVNIASVWVGRGQQKSFYTPKKMFCKLYYFTTMNPAIQFACFGSSSINPFSWIDLTLMLFFCSPKLECTLLDLSVALAGICPVCFGYFFFVFSDAFKSSNLE